MTDPRLGRLTELAGLRAARSAARLAPAEARAAALREADAGLRTPAPRIAADPAMAVVADRHEIWRQDALRHVAIARARAEAEAQPLREAHARDLAREAVLRRLRDR